MKKNYKFLFFVSVIIIFPLESISQIGSFFTKFEPSRRWSLGFQISPTETNGDADNIQFGTAIGLHAKYSFGQTFAVKFSGNIGQLKGGRDYQQISRNGSKQYNGLFRRGLNINDPGNQAPSEDSYEFTNNFKDFNVSTVYTLGNLSFLRPLRKYQIFMLVGAGAIWSKAKGDWTDTIQRWKQVAGDYKAPVGEFLTYNGGAKPNGKIKSAVNFAVPFGIGVKRNFGTKLDLGIEYRMHYTRCDNLDALSAPVWRNRFTDYYSLLSFQASFKIKNKKDNDENHYDWLNPIESLYEKMDSINNVATALSKDGDGDGVADFLDKDPNTPEGSNVYGNGKSIDSDGDGIDDTNDSQPFSEKNAIVDDKGVMLDEDNDGVPDFRDEDTKTPVNSIVNNKGIHVTPQSSPSSSTSSSATCCDCNDVVFPPIVFEKGSSKIKPEYYGILHEIASKMKECPELRILTIGYPDGVVGAKSGEQLSRMRVTEVVDYLNDYYGIQRNRINVDYKTTIDESSKYQKNRKVEIKKADK
ncbi:MAG: OmpA family protein [Bacteroidia bacterium]|nr:OmpA family protein [Bacteroidia bacterium]